MNVNRFIGKLSKALDTIQLKARVSYAQSGEDIIVDCLFTNYNYKKISYLDLGANQPVLCNNTYLFYRNGSRGVLVEPDVTMCNLAKTKRPEDIILNIGIGLTAETEMPFYLFPGHLNTWSTFSADEAKLREIESGVIAKKVMVPLKTINDIIEKYFDSCPNFVSIDVEGWDLQILQSLDFSRFRPEVFCVESISFSIDNTEEKLGEISAFLHSKGYITYADTHINTIFCDAALFRKI